MQVLKLPTIDLMPKKQNKQTDKENFEAKFVGCIGKCRKCCHKDYDQSEGATGFKSVL